MAGQARNGGQRVIPRDVAGTVNGDAVKSPPLDRQPSLFICKFEADDMGTSDDCSDVTAHRLGLDHAVAAPLAQPAGGRVGAARICELFEAVVAFFDARGRWPGL